MMKITHKLFLILGVMLLTMNANGQLRLPAIFSDYMVLQQKSLVPIWGWAAPDAPVNIRIGQGDAVYQTTTDPEGKWSADIRIPEAGKEFSLEITSGTDAIVLNHVVSGEVWLCSGQSNMEMPLAGWPNQPITESERYIREGNYPDIRLFTVERKTAYEAQDDCTGQWTPATPASVAAFSATGYFFGLKLYQELGVPIGLIHSSWGGTPAEAWTSDAYMKNIPEMVGTGQFDAEQFRARKLKEFEKDQMEWARAIGFYSPTTPPEWVQTDFDAADWQKSAVPANWSTTEVGVYEGMVDFRFEFEVPAKWRKKTTILELGPIDEMDLTWINGVLVGQHLNVYDWATDRSYIIPPGVLKKGKNTVAIQVANTSGLGGMNGKPDQMKIYPEGAEQNAQFLSGQWTFRKEKSFEQIAPMPNCVHCSEPQTPTTLYNGMIAPIIPFAIKGAVWYQGESNRVHGSLYQKIFSNMIHNWRSDWNQGDFPFYFVQIAPYTYQDELSTGLLREAQLHTLVLPNTGMVVTMDVGSMTTIHPPDKKTVGFRLARWALAKDYGFDELTCSGPLYKAWKKEDDRIRLFFDYADEGLLAKDGPLKHFQIAGQDRQFVPAQAVIDGTTVVVFSPDVTDPYAVRFGWGSTDETNLFNTAQLPASPFRTDIWP